MGNFINAEEMKAKALLDFISRMEVEDIEDILIAPAERVIEEHFNIDLNTDAEPREFVARFERIPRLRTEFQTDYKRAVILYVNRMAVNPHGYGSQSVAGASLNYGKRMPPEVVSLMRKWGRAPRIFRA